MADGSSACAVKASLCAAAAAPWSMIRNDPAYTAEGHVTGTMKSKRTMSVPVGTKVKVESDVGVLSLSIVPMETPCVINDEAKLPLHLIRTLRPVTVERTQNVHDWRLEAS